jgi:1-acyl-sn-glycerol-3-phosphate acyltransferase
MSIERINYVWRVLATGFSFACFFGGGLLLALTVFPAIAVLTPEEKQRIRATQSVIHRTFRFYLGMLEVLGLIELSVRGGAALHDGKGRLVIANHPTLLDVVILMALLPRVQCIVKSELWHNRYLGGVMRWAGYIRNDLEPSALIGACQEAIADGRSLIIFPEGTRTRPGQPLQFHRGFANIALLTRVETQLVVIDCQPVMLSKGDPWWKVPPRKSRFCVTVGERLRPVDVPPDQHRSLAARQLVRQLQTYYTEQLAHG